MDTAQSAEQLDGTVDSRRTAICKIRSPLRCAAADREP